MFDHSQLAPLAAELFLLTAACVILVVDLFLRDRYRQTTYVLTLVTLAGSAALAGLNALEPRQVLLEGAYVRDAMGDVLKIAVLGVMLLGFLYSRDYLKQRGIWKGEFYVLGLFATLGMLIMISANSFLPLYLGLELLALSMYALVAFDRDSKVGSEAAMKYFVLGAMASGMLLYGISMIYGATTHLDFPGVAEVIGAGQADLSVLVFGLVFLVVGLAFKFGAVPFHMWLPDVYHGAPTPVTLLLGSAPKIAAFGMAMRILVDGMGDLQAGWDGWQGMLILLAIASLAIGNLIAIAQDNIKRMLAYSTISHVGFIFLGLLAGGDKGFTAAMFYAITYAVMAAGGFGLLTLLSREGFECENLHDLKGLNQRSPWLAGMMLLVMFSMAGVPPLVGFFAKLFVLDALINAGLTWLALVGVFFSIIGAYYYLRVIKMMYFDNPISSLPISASLDARMAISINGLVLLLLGIFPAGLLGVCRVAIAG